MQTRLFGHTVVSTPVPIINHIAFAFTFTFVSQGGNVPASSDFEAFPTLTLRLCSGPLVRFRPSCH